ncbi:AMIN-like domain-containing (lipo)protein [Fusibacter ferrireducens]|uniref:AMIN-like domain-containing protein n=1 Tax=Fusibacter ferrireducens TaxID=2785058 RepID=A0ABR9ZW59_9FIRM|nr:hypothetical protein [Fusibacter ferrireducens]MBF4694581.1 hypothetical protein [Fusibacter ferrireducens]
MKCPNCSFMNPDQSVMCKICGYEFDNASAQKGSHNSNSATPSDDDSEIEVTFDTLFGVRSNSRKIKNPLEKSKDKRRVFAANDESSEPFEAVDSTETAAAFGAQNFDAQNTDVQDINSTHDSSSLENSADENYNHRQASSVLRPHDPPLSHPVDETPEPFAESDAIDQNHDANGDIIDIELVQNGDIHNDFYASDEALFEEDHKTDNRKITIILLAVVVLLIALVFAFTSSKLKFNPFASEPAPETPVAEPVDNTSNDPNSPQTNNVIHADPDATVESFFEELPGYVNDNNISFSMYFKTPQSALEILTAFKNKGQIDKIEYDISNTALDDEKSATIDVVSSIERTNENKHIISQDEWSFKLSLEGDVWLIQDFLLNNQDSTVSSTSSTTNANDSTSNNTSSSSTSNSTTTSTPPIKPTGFVKTGSFKGGVITDGQDINSIRYGNHDQFERIVIDLTEWQKTNADGSAVKVNEACHYEATISSDGLEVQVVLSGVRAASAVAPIFAKSSNIESLGVYYPSDDSTIGLSVKLKKPSSYKVFSLKEPGRIVIDTMPN